MELPRPLLRSFRLALRRAGLAGQRNRPPAVLCEAGPHGLSLSCVGEEEALRYADLKPRARAVLALPAEALAHLEGAEGVVSLEEAGSPGGLRARWREGGSPRLLELAAPPSAPSFPEPSGPWSEAGEPLWRALGEAARVARGAERARLTQALLRPSRGEVVATDGRQLLALGGLKLPAGPDALVPALALFAQRPQGPARAARARGHLLVEAGAWTAALKLSPTAGYPDVDAALARAEGTASRLEVGANDARTLLLALPRLPRREEGCSPVELVLGPRPRVRAAAEEVALPNSRASGPACRTHTDRRYLERALKLGLLELSVAAPPEAIICARAGPSRLLWMALDGAAAGRGRARVMKEEEAVPTNDNKVTGPEVGRGDDALAEAEALRSRLQEALGRAARLVALLRQQRRQGKAVQAAMASLRKLGELGP